MASLIAIVRTLRSVSNLRVLEPVPPEQWPRVSLIIPAGNEVAQLEPAITSRLGDGYQRWR